MLEKDQFGGQFGDLFGDLSGDQFGDDFNIPSGMLIVAGRLGRGK
jgi:hypothetical protein